MAFLPFLTEGVSEPCFEMNQQVLNIKQQETKNELKVIKSLSLSKQKTWRLNKLQGAS